MSLCHCVTVVCVVCMPETSRERGRYLQCMLVGMTSLSGTGEGGRFMLSGTPRGCNDLQCPLPALPNNG